jgi:hypothetical protein
MASSLPEEIARRVDRKASLATARKIIEERYEEAKKHKQADYEIKQKDRDEQRKSGRKSRGREPQPPSDTPSDKAQFNFTDQESRIMKAGSGDHMEQAYNAQAVIDTEGAGCVLCHGKTRSPSDC